LLGAGSLGVAVIVGWPLLSDILFYVGLDGVTTTLGWSLLIILLGGALSMACIAVTIVSWVIAASC